MPFLTLDQYANCRMRVGFVLLRYNKGLIPTVLVVKQSLDIIMRPNIRGAYRKFSRHAPEDEIAIKANALAINDNRHGVASKASLPLITAPIRIFYFCGIKESSGILPGAISGSVMGIFSGSSPGILPGSISGVVTGFSTVSPP